MQTTLYISIQSYLDNAVSVFLQCLTSFFDEKLTLTLSRKQNDNMMKVVTALCAESNS